MYKKNGKKRKFICINYVDDILNILYNRFILIE